MFARDETVSALQAADIICWGSRRKESRSGFPKGLESIEAMIGDESSHHRSNIERSTLQEMEDYFRSTKRGICA